MEVTTFSLLYIAIIVFYFYSSIKVARVVYDRIKPKIWVWILALIIALCIFPFGLFAFFIPKPKKDNDS